MLHLVPMTDAEFTAFLERTVAEYAAEKVRSGNWPAGDAAERSRQEHQRLLPQGLQTPNQHIYTLQVEGLPEPVGDVWLAVEAHGEKRTGFIYDLYVQPAHRRRGYGRAAMLAAEAEARRLGCASLGLHVFAHNTAATELYHALGYQVTNIVMSKDLADRGAQA
jgi:GNAT superfamily N-acetyltransferase